MSGKIMSHKWSIACRIGGLAGTALLVWLVMGIGISPVSADDAPTGEQKRSGAAATDGAAGKLKPSKGISTHVEFCEGSKPPNCPEGCRFDEKLNACVLDLGMGIWTVPGIPKP